MTKTHNLKIDKKTIGKVVEIKLNTSRNKDRTQTIKGICISLKNRKEDMVIELWTILGNIGVNYKLPLASPFIKSIEILDQVNPVSYKKSKLYFLRNRSNKVINKLMKTTSRKMK